MVMRGTYTSHGGKLRFKFKLAFGGNDVVLVVISIIDRGVDHHFPKVASEFLRYCKNCTERILLCFSLSI